MGEQPNRGDRLHGFAEAHFVGEHRGVARIEKRDAVELEGKRRVGEAERLGGEQRFERRLEQHPQSVGEFHDVARRADARGGDVSVALCRAMLRVTLAD